MPLIAQQLELVVQLLLVAKKRDELSSCVLVGAPSLLVRVHTTSVSLPGAASS